MGIIPNKWQLFVDLSSPKGFSVNEGIPSELSSLSYASLDHLSALVLSAGKFVWLVKADVKEAHRMIPIRPHDEHLLGVQWENCLYVDKRLPFGLRSVPKIFSAVADAIQLTKKGIHNCLHYLDNYILVASSKSEAEQQKQMLCSMFNKLKVPLKTSKLDGPATCLSFLGKEVDGN